MESLFQGFSCSPPLQNLLKTQKPPASNSISFFLSSCSASNSFNSYKAQILLPQKISLTNQAQSPIPKSNAIRTTQYSNPSKSKYPVLENHSLFFKHWLKSQLSLVFTGLSFPLSSLASDSAFPAEGVSNKINLEEIVVSIDQFFTRYPFFVYTVGVIWLIVIPLTEEYFQKYKFTSAIDGFKKLKEDPSAQLLDIRDKKTLQALGSPNLKILNKSAVQVEYREGDDEVFVKEVLEKFSDPQNTIICILDNFDGNSMKVAELLVKYGFKEAYAIRDGVRGNNGWQAIQESLLPPSVHIYPRKKAKGSQQPEINGGEAEKSNKPSSATLSSGESVKYQDSKPPPSSPTPTKT